MLAAVAILFAASIPLALTKLDFPQRARALRPAGSKAPRTTTFRLAAPLLAALSGAVFTGVFMGWTYNLIGSIIALNGFSARAVGPVVAIGLISSVLGALLPTLLGARLTPATGVGLMCGLDVLFSPALTSHAMWVFGAAFGAYTFVATAAYAYFLGLVRALDVTDRIYVSYPALQAVAIAAGTALAGSFLATQSVHLFFGIAAAASLASWLGAAAADRLSRQAAPIPEFEVVQRDAV